MRPRGESISSPHSRYVGQVGRQNPQWTQVSMPAIEGPSGPPQAARRGDAALAGGRGACVTPAPGRRPGCPRDPARASARRAAATTARGAPHTSTGALQLGRRAQQHHVAQRGSTARRRATAAACAATSPSRRRNPAPTAARPTKTSPGRSAGARLDQRHHLRQRRRRPRAPHRGAPLPRQRQLIAPGARLSSSAASGGDARHHRRERRHLGGRGRGLARSAPAARASAA